MKKFQFLSIVRHALRLPGTTHWSWRELLFVSFFITPTLAQTQSYCETSLPPEPEQIGGDGNCSNYWNYVPDIPTHFPIKTVRLMMHVMHQSVTDPLNFVPGDEYVLSDIVDDLNNKMGNFQQVSPNPFGSPHYPDSRVRFSFNPATDIHYYVDPNAWARTYQSPGGYQGVYNHTVATNPNLSPADLAGYLHILVTGISSNGDGPCKIGGAVPILGGPCIGFGSWWCATIGTNAGIYTDVINSITGNFRHELGHNLIGLGHIYDNTGDGCGDTEDCSNSTIYCSGGASNNLMDNWQTCQCGISACQLGKLHYRIENLPAIFARLRPDHCTFDAGQTITINSGEDVYWTAKREMYGNLVIEPGAKLTIQCQISFPWGGKLIVKPGGKLVLDGNGKLTNICGDFWSGIEVWGDNAHNQQPTSQPTHQGMVVLKNGATIEHAREAIVLGQDGVWNTFGGVVQATDAHFINCRRSVAFATYQNTNSNGAPIANRSFFSRCEFKVDDSYRGGNDFYAHVSMWDVSGIRFKACDFINAQSTPLTIQQSEHLGKGIIALDANFSVSGTCDVVSACNPGQPIPPCPPGQLRPSRFIGLDHGINAMQFGTGRTFTVTTSEFTNNICGIYASQVNNFSVLRCSFTSGNREVDLSTHPLEQYWQGAHRAIYNYAGNGFRIEENSFGKDANTPNTLEVEGVVNGYTGAFNDQVYKNTAAGINQGYVAEGHCYDPGNPTTVGLCMLCNSNDNNIGRDLVVRVPPNAGQTTPADNIRMFQGSVNQGAGNSFTPNQNGPYTYFNFENEPAQLPIQYFENGSAMSPGAFNVPWVNEATSSNSHPCPTRIICGGGSQVRSFLTPQVQQANIAYLNLKYVYESLLDGGDFDDLKETIMLTWPSEAWDLRNELMSYSPYLSVDILFETANRNILPDAMMLEVCLANPDATQQQGFIRWIEQEAPNPLPQYMLAQIMASWDQETWRTSLESGMAEQLTEMGRLNATIIGALRTDSVPEPLDSVLVRWQSDQTLGARYGEAQTLLELKRYTAATALMEGLESRYILREHDLEEKQDMLALITLFTDLEANGLSPMQLDVGRRTTLAVIGEGWPTHAGVAAQNLLCFGYGDCASPLTGGSLQVRSMWQKPTSIGDTTPPTIRAYPNPASVFVTIEHHALAELKDGYLSFRDLTGRELERRKISASPGQVLWDTRDLAPGVYSVELYNGAVLLGSQRIVIKP